MSKIKNLNVDNIEETIKDGVTMIDFFAVWCGPCKMIAPVIKELAEDFDGKATICKVDTDANKELAIKYEIRSIPTIIFLKDGEIIDRITGAASKDTFTKKINELLE